MASHFLILCLFSILVGAFFSALTRDTLREGVKSAMVLIVTMIGMSLIVAYVMYFLPLGK